MNETKIGTDGIKIFKEITERDGIEIHTWKKSNSNQIHNIDEPAIAGYFLPNREKHYERWMKDGKNHRENGPQFVQWNIEGEIIAKSYWLNGEWKNTEREVVVLKRKNLLTTIKNINNE